MAMTDDDIKGLLAKEIKAARSQDDTELADKRRRALEYFNGEMNDTPAEEGRSSVVSRDLADTVGWMLPQLMRVFLSSHRMVQVEPADTGDIHPMMLPQLPPDARAAMTPAQVEQFIEAAKEKLLQEQAKEATEYLNYLFWKANPGYRTLRDGSWDSLVIGNGIIKLWHDPTAEYATSFHTGMSDEQVAMLESEDGVEITHQTTEVDPSTGLNVHEIKVKRLKSKGRRRIECIPPEDYLRSDDPPGTERPRFEGHRSYKTRSELIEMGFRREKVDALSTAGDDSAEQTARDDGYLPPKDIADKSMETVEYVEGFLRADVDDDGIAEVIRTHYIGPGQGGVLLDWEVWEDEGPFFDIPCDPVPHRWDAKSIADETMDMQRVKTVLWRAALDNTYASNNPTRFVKGEIVNPDALFSPAFGEVVFGKGNAEVVPLPVPFVANHAYEALAYSDEIIQRRTGQGRQSMALDPDTLQNQTATANQNNKDAAYSQTELVARDMSELGWTPLFRAWLRLEIKHQDRPTRIKVGRESKLIDPRSWNADMNLTVNVGLGTGSRDRDMMMLQQVLANQLGLADRFMASGATEQAIEMLPKVIETMTKIAESAGLRNPDSFYPEDAEAIVAKLKAAAAQPKPDPVVEAEKAKLAAKVEETRVQSEAAVTKEKAQLEADALTNQQKQQFEREKLQKEYEFKYAELRQYRDIELMKLGVQTTTTDGADGQPGATHTTFDGTPVMMAQLLDRFEALQSSLTAPKRVVRDAQGRAVGVETVTN